ncbi:MAG: PCRF domain-containing protein, partial [Micrococcales bacterium]|nr:PCRF domain-containing protein [Micrococcales bacterium]
MTLEQTQARVDDLSHRLASIEAVVDPDAKRAQIGELEQQVAEPNLWDDQARAQQLTSKLSALNADVDRLTSLRKRLDDAEVLAQLAAEAEDAESAAEADREVAGLSQEIETLEIRTLLSGEYDQREALITIRSEAGGVDAADWASMLLRMYERWADRHRYAYEV